MILNFRKYLIFTHLPRFQLQLLYGRLLLLKFSIVLHQEFETMKDADSILLSLLIDIQSLASWVSPLSTSEQSQEFSNANSDLMLSLSILMKILALFSVST